MEYRVPETIASSATDVDKYVADIEFSNSCRQFYISRLKATEVFKHSVHSACGNDSHQKHTTSIDSAMTRLRNEMVGTY